MLPRHFDTFRRRGAASILVMKVISTNLKDESLENTIIYRSCLVILNFDMPNLMIFICIAISLEIIRLDSTAKEYLL